MTMFFDKTKDNVTFAFQMNNATGYWEIYQKEVFHVGRSADDIRSAFGTDYFIQPCPVENFNQTFVISMKRPGFR